MWTGAGGCKTECVSESTPARASVCELVSGPCAEGRAAGSVASDHRRVSCASASCCSLPVLGGRRFGGVPSLRAGGWICREDSSSSSCGPPRLTAPGQGTPAPPSPTGGPLVRRVVRRRGRRPAGGRLRWNGGGGRQGNQRRVMPACPGRPGCRCSGPS